MTKQLFTFKDSKLVQKCHPKKNVRVVVSGGRSWVECCDCGSLLFYIELDERFGYVSLEFSTGKTERIDA